MSKEIKNIKNYSLDNTQKQNILGSIFGYIIFIAIIVLIIWIFKPSPINGTWVNSLIQSINNSRMGRGIYPLIYCEPLNNYSKTRLIAISANYNISDYNGSNITSEAEDIFYPQGYSPSSFYNYLLSNASARKCILGYSDYCLGYTYYGYSLGNTLAYEINQNCPTPNIGTYLPTFYSENNCNPSIKNTTLLVIELSNSCR